MTVSWTAAELAELREMGLDPNAADLEERLTTMSADDLEWLIAAAGKYPLAAQVLWTNEAAQCDQRRAVAGVMRAPLVGLILGGWASGKSAGLKQLTVAYALGAEHPATQAWLTLNDLPRDVIPDGPSEVYAIAQSSSDSRRYHRPHFDALVSPGTGHWRGRNGTGEAELTISVPGSKAAGKIWFKSVDQGRRSYQGIEIPWWWIDEEPLGLEGWEVVDELKGRSARIDGRGGISMIPKSGLTWVHRDYIVGADGRPKDDARVHYLDTLDNPHTSRTGMERAFAGMSADEIAINRRGEFKSKSGAIYDWHSGDGDRWGPGHICEDFPIPEDWLRFRGADFGLVNPTCVLWAALGDDDTLYVYREHYEAGPTYEQHGERVAVLSEGESDEGSWGDPAAAQVMSEIWAAMDVYFGLANNSVKDGINAIKNRLRLRADGRPRLKVFRQACPNLIRELPAYQWDPNRKDEVPLKKDDHAPDALRYLAMGVNEVCPI